MFNYNNVKDLCYGEIRVHKHSNVPKFYLIYINNFFSQIEERTNRREITKFSDAHLYHRTSVSMMLLTAGYERERKTLIFKNN